MKIVNEDYSPGPIIGISMGVGIDIDTKSQILNVTTPLTDFRGIWGLLEYYARNDITDKEFIKTYFTTLKDLVGELNEFVSSETIVFGCQYPRQRILYKSIRIISFIFVLLREYGYSYDEVENILGLIKLFEENDRT